MTTVPHPRPALLDFARDFAQDQRPTATTHAEPHLRLVTAVERLCKGIKGWPRGGHGDQYWIKG